MKVLLIGGGGREHALAWKLKQSPLVDEDLVRSGECWDCGGSGMRERGFGRRGGAGGARGKNSAGLDGRGTGVAAGERDRGCVCAAEMGDCGAYATGGATGRQQDFFKEFLQRHNIPTAEMYGAYDSASDAYAALQTVKWPVVIKADGLCAGKGVFLAPDRNAAKDFIVGVMEKQELGEGGKRILLEETLEGEELSFIILTDGERYAALVPTRDHKRVFDGNEGPNTGGMGAYSSDDLLPSALRETIVTQIVEPTLHGLAADGIRYQDFCTLA